MNYIEVFYILGSFGVLMFVWLLFVAYYRLFSKYKELKDKNLESEAEFNEKTNSVILKAHEDYIKIIQEANEKAKDIVEQALVLKVDSKKTIDDSLKKVSKQQDDLIKKLSEKLAKEYQLELKKANDKNIQTISNVSKDIEEYTLGQVEDYKKIVQMETLESQKILEQKTDAEFGEIKKELEKYKNEQIQKINEDNFKILEETLKLILGKSLNIDLQEKIVLESLEQAKKNISEKVN